MPRKTRIQFPGAIYHVMCRGNNRETVLGSNNDKKLYLHLLDKYKQRYDFKIYAYCIMSNHVHLLIETGTTPLSKIMQGIQQSYTQTYNKRYDRTGHVFQQRYKALLCDKESYLLQLVKYIHYNPVEACIEEGLDYKWSSHKDYLYASEKSLVEVKFVLETLGNNNLKQGLKEYIKFMKLDHGNIDPQEFQMDEEEIKETLKQSETENRPEQCASIESDYIIKCVCEIMGLSIDEMIQKTKVNECVLARKAVVLLTDRYSQIPNKELSKKLNLSPTSTSRIRRERPEKGSELSCLLDLVSKNLLHFERNEISQA